MKAPRKRNRKDELPSLSSSQPFGSEPAPKSSAATPRIRGQIELGRSDACRLQSPYWGPSTRALYPFGRSGTKGKVPSKGEASWAPVSEGQWKNQESLVS